MDEYYPPWPVGTCKAEIRVIAAPRLALLNGDNNRDLDQQFGNTQFIHARERMNAGDLAERMKYTEEHMMVDAMIAMWRKGYWPRTPLVVRWYVMKDIGVGLPGVNLGWVEQTS